MVNLMVLIIIFLVVSLIVYFVAAIFKPSFTAKNRVLKWGLIISVFYVLIMNELWNAILVQVDVADWIIGLVTLAFLILPTLIAHLYDRKYNYNKQYNDSNENTVKNINENVDEDINKNINEANVKKEESNNGEKIITSLKNCSKKLTKRNKIIFVIVGIFVVVSFGIGINRVSQKRYSNSIVSTSEKIINLGADSEKIINNYISLWNGKINENYTTQWTREYIAQYIGLDVNDFIRNTKPIKFNNAITFDDVLQCYSQYNNNIGIDNNLKKRLDEIEKDVKNLNDPPSKFKESYNQLTQMYVNLNTLVGLATNPSGSLISYRNDKNTLDNNIMKEYNLLKTQLPN